MILHPIENARPTGHKQGPEQVAAMAKGGSVVKWLRTMTLWLTITHGVASHPSTLKFSEATRNFGSRFSDGFVVTLHNSKERDGQFERILSQIQKTPIRHFAFGILATQEDRTSSTVQPDRVQNQWVFRQIQRLRSLGYTSSLIPILYGVSDQSWRGHFQPKNPGDWLASYSAWLTEVAEKAQEHGVAELSVASEMDQLYNAHKNSFVKIIQNVRQKFLGPVFVTFHSLKTAPLDLIYASDAISISAYIPLTRYFLNQSCQNLLKGYAQELRNAAIRFLRPIHITEIGYPSTEIGTKEPWNFAAIESNQIEVSYEEQRCGYTAVTEAFGKDQHVARVQFWELSDDQDPNFHKSYSPISKPAWESVVEFFTRRRSLEELFSFTRR